MNNYIAFFAGAAISNIVYLIMSSREKTCYGYTFKEFNSFPNSKQERIRFEWHLDNNKEDIKFIDDLIKILDEGKLETLEQAKKYEKELNRLERKYGYMAVRFNLRTLENYIFDKELVAQKGKEENK